MKAQDKAALLDLSLGCVFAFAVIGLLGLMIGFFFRAVLWGLGI